MHDRYWDENYPTYRSHGDNHQYLEKDYFAHEADDQLPLLSAMGAGPRGEGVTAKITKDEEGEFRFDLISDLTNEVIFHSPNLSPGALSFNNIDGKFVAKVKQGINIHQYEIPMPEPKRPTQIFLPMDTTARYTTGSDGLINAYIPLDELNNISGYSPEPGDIVIWRSTNPNLKEAMFIGYIQSVSPNEIVARESFHLGLPEITVDDAGHWVIDGYDTLIEAKGPRGDQGEQGYSLDIQPGVLMLEDLPDFYNTPVNTAYLVDDKDGRLDLYIRSKNAIEDTLWNIVEDFQGPKGDNGTPANLTYVSHDSTVYPWQEE